MVETCESSLTSPTSRLKGTTILDSESRTRKYAQLKLVSEGNTCLHSLRVVACMSRSLLVNDINRTSSCLDVENSFVSGFHIFQNLISLIGA